MLLFGMLLAPAERLSALDLDLPRVGSYEGDAALGSVVVSGPFAYCGSSVWASSNYLEIIDISKPGQPTLVRRYDTSGWPYGLPASTNFTYVADSNETWMVYDITNPDQPQRVGGYKTIAASYDSWFGPHRPRVAGEYAYFIQRGDTNRSLEIVDIRDPANPQRVGRYDAVGWIDDVAISGTYAYLAAEDDGFQILDIRDPSAPVLAKSMSGIGVAYSVALYSHYALVGVYTGYNSLLVVDIQDPATPQIVGSYSDSGDETQVMAVSEPYVFLRGYGDFTVLDISDPIHPKLAGRGDPTENEYEPENLTMNDGYVYATGFTGLKVFKIQPANPQPLSRLQFVQPGAGTAFASRVAVTTNLVCVTDDSAGVQIVDTSDPANPRQVGSYGTGGTFYGIGMYGHYAFVTGSIDRTIDSSYGLHVLDLSEPVNPRGIARLSGWFSGLAFSNGYAYVTSASGGKDGFQVIDISDPAHPRSIGRYVSAAGGVSGIALSGHLVCLATRGIYAGTNYLGGGGLEVVDVTNPTAPVRAGAFDIGGNATSLAVSAHFAYVTVEPSGFVPDWVGDGLMVFDIADPANPRRVGSYGQGEWLDCVAASGDYAYVQHVDAGLEVINVANPNHPYRTGGNTAVTPSNGIRQLVFAQDRLFAAAAEQGMVIFDPFRPFQLESAVDHQTGELQLGLEGPRGLSVVVQRSTDLVHWDDWQSVTLPIPPWPIGGSDGLASLRQFYRAVWK